MQIVETQSAVLSNHEVLLHVQSVHKRYAERVDYADRSGAKLFQLHSVVNDVRRAHPCCLFAYLGH